MQACVADEERVGAIKSGRTEEKVDPKRGEFVNRMVFRNSHPDLAHASHHLAKFETWFVRHRRAKLFGLPHGPVDVRGADDCLGWHRPGIRANFRPGDCARRVRRRTRAVQRIRLPLVQPAPRL